MVFRTISSKSSNRSGLTTLELLVATGLASVIFALLTSTFIFNARSFSGLTNYVDLDQKSRNALDSMSKEIRRTRWLTDAGTNYLIFEDNDGLPLQYTYNAEARTLTRSKNGVPDARPLLKECDFLQFSTFQRNHIPGTFDQYPTATATNCKLVQMTWICSRQILGTTFNTESVQSAKVVIRRR